MADPDPDSVRDAVAAGSGAGRLPRGGVALLAFVAALPVLIAAVVATRDRWFGGSDWALEVLRVSDVGTRHTPLVGVVSRFGWYHPGPLLYWTLSPGFRLFGQSGLLGTTGGSNALAVAAIVVLAHRRGGAALCAWCFLLTAILLHALGAPFLINPWNPYPPFLWFVVFALAVWSVGEGDRTVAPLAVVAGSFAVQSHVGYLPLVVALPALSAVGAWAQRFVGARRRRVAAVEVGSATDSEVEPASGLAVGPGAPRSGRSRRPWWLAAALFVALWLAPVAQQLGGHPGNLQAILDYFLHAKDPAVGFSVALGIMGRQLAPIGPWITSRETTPIGLSATAGVIPALGLLAVVGLAGALAARRGATDAGRLALLAVVSAMVGCVATADVRGLPIPYLFHWWWGIAFLLWFSLGWSGWRLFVAWRSNASVPGHRLASTGQPGPGSDGRRRATVDVGAAGSGAARLPMVVFAAMVIGGAVLLSVTGVEATAVSLPLQQKSDAVAALDGPVRAHLQHGTRYLVVIDDQAGLQEVGLGLFASLRLHGFDVFLPATPSNSPGVGAWRTSTVGATGATIAVLTAPLDAATRAHLPAGARILASYDPLTPATRAEVTRLSDRVRTQIGRPTSVTPLPVSTTPQLQAGLLKQGANPADLKRLAELQHDTEPYVVYLVRRG